jgi:hypothetical protein
MAMRQELTPEQADRQAGFDASYEAAQRRLGDRRFVASLRRRLADLDVTARTPRLTKSEFLEQTAHS